MGAIPGLVVESRRLSVPSPEALRHEKFVWIFKKFAPCFLTPTVSFEDKLPVKNQSTNTMVIWATLLLQGLQLPANNNEKQNFQHHTSPKEVWALSVYWLSHGLLKRGNLARFPQGGTRFFPSPLRVQTTLGNLTAPFSIGFSGGKAARTWGWSHSPISCRGYEWVLLHLDSAICLHGMHWDDCTF